MYDLILSEYAKFSYILRRHQDLFFFLIKKSLLLSYIFPFG